MASGTIAEPSPPPEPAGSPVAVPTPPMPQEKTVAVLMFERFDAIEKRLDQQATAIVKIAEMVTSPPSQQAPQASGVMGIIQQLLPGLNEALKGGSVDPMNQLYIDVGKSVVEGSLKGTVQRVVKAAGAAGANHVTGLG